MLKQKGIDASDPGRVVDPLEAKKERLLARDEERTKKQTERHVLTKAMSNHPIPRLFVSRRNDKSPNGFNCAICRKDVSFLSRGPSGIWRHFKCKSHYQKDRRYRYDHEDVIFTEKFDAVPVADLSVEVREEIEATPPVVLGKMNRFVEDEVDALVGVPYNVPPTTLVGCLFELLRSGGSQGFLRRLWNHFRTTLPVESPYASASWSKTETLVVMVQTLYPRVLRRLKSWLGDSPFSLSIQTSHSGVRCIVRCCPDDSLREICFVDEDHGMTPCDAEMQCLSRVLSLVATDKGPVALQGCPPILFNAYTDWCRVVGRPVPLVAVVFDDDYLRRLIHEASFMGVGSVDPFSTVDYLAQRLRRFRHQSWLMQLPRFRLCLESGVVPFDSLCDVLQELIDNWVDIKLCLSNDVLLMKKNVNVVDLDSLLCSDRLGLPRLALLHVVLLCFRANCGRLFDSAIRDYACRSFTDCCFFYWSLLSKVKKLSQLPSIDNWFDYIDKPLNSWASVTAAECLQSEPSIMKAVRGLEDAPRRSFLRECQGYLLELLKLLGASSFIKSRIARSLSCLSIDMLFGGDADYVSELFQDLCSCFAEAGYVGDVDREAAVNEFKSLLVDLRRQSVDHARVLDVFQYLESNDSFQCRTNAKRVIRLVRAIVCPAPKDMPAVEISVGGPTIIRSGLKCVQSFVLHPKFVSSDLLTIECLEELKGNMPVGHQFLSRGDFDPFSGVSRHPSADIYSSLLRCYTAYYTGQVESWRARMSGASTSTAKVAPTAGTSEVECSGSGVSSQTQKGSKGSKRYGKSL